MPINYGVASNPVHHIARIQNIYTFKTPKIKLIN